MATATNREKIPVLERQRPDFLGGVPIVLADGQEYYFPKPAVRFRRDSGARGVKVVLSLSGDDDYQARLDALEDAYKYASTLRDLDADEQQARYAESGRPSQILLELDVAASLLQRNYTLTDDEVDGLLIFGYDQEDEEGCSRRDEIMNAARGIGPKLSPAGAE